MKIVALVSGGKDSCYNMMQCVANGHEIVALANLKPPTSSGKDELDSYMYQTVGHDAIHLYSECMELPLYRREILGGSIAQGSDYKATANDETEDLYVLLQEVLRNHPDIQGVSVGAILSNYQRVRVEHVCNRLGLTSFAFLWRREQKDLLYEMASAGVNAILIKIAAIGLKTAHLGKSIGQMYPYLCKMNDMYDLHICGEGGEYETFTVDCPLFKKRIVIEETETVIHSDDAFAQVAYLKFKKLSVESKSQDEMDMSNVVIQDWKDWERYEEITSAILNAQNTVVQPKLLLTSEFNAAQVDYKVEDQAPFFAISGTTAFDQDATAIFGSIEEETIACMRAVEEKLTANNLHWSDLVTMNVFVRDMDDFGRINAVYKKFFDINPSPRALVGADLKGNSKLQIDAIAIKALENVKRDTMHVQGISYWAPANIGPYSQSVVTQGHAFIAGQIGLVPNTLNLPSPLSFADEAALSLRNLENIVSVLDMSLPSNVAFCYCFVSDAKYLPLAKTAWEAYMESVPPTVYIAVPALPRGAMVEWQVILNAPLPLLEDDSSTDEDEDRDTSNKLKALSLEEANDLNCGSHTRCRAVKKSNMTTIMTEITDAKNIEDAVSQLITAVNECLKQYQKQWSQVLSLRTFYYDKLDMTGQTLSDLFAAEIQKKSDRVPIITSIPVHALGANGDSIIACALHVL